MARISDRTCQVSPVISRIMRAQRLLALVACLQVRGRATAAELGVSERTIYRDLEALSQVGFPVVTDRGPGGGCALLPGYRNRVASASSLTQAEADALMLAGLPGQARELGFGALLAAGQRKLLAALPPRVRETAAHAAQRFHLDAADWFRQAPEHPALAEVARLVWSDRRARLRYRRGGGRIVDRLVRAHHNAHTRTSSQNAA